ncbi:MULTISPECIES: DUF3821 domain-containing protein [unclassified Methanoregula]|uniref:DUF3821 domain-containing protein n=1 Tax=unclassified Methanoregula TaxID=2649730 RepID=UPI0025EAD31E|nr:MULTISPECIES: DUF3821 domain-containing protein [unclassified Methanoregula]
MHGKLFFILFAVIVVVTAPVAGSLTKIAAGAPVYIGEQNLNIAAGLQGCRAIEWYEPGADLTGPAQKNVVIIKTLEDSNIAFRYTIDPAIYNGYEGNWYCAGWRPLRPVFEVRKPNLTVRFWDLDRDEDVTGKTVPQTANITFRIDTNLDKALQYKYRPEMTPLDSFYTLSLMDPSNKVLTTIYTGSTGKAGAHGILIEKNPLITTTPYFWKDGSSWDRTSRDAQGDAMYRPGSYSVLIKQNLNNMEAMYSGLYPDERAGLLESTASVTFTRPESTAVPTTVAMEKTPTKTVVATTSETPASSPASSETTAEGTTAPVKTTYAPFPPWIVAAALGLACACAARNRR